MEAAIDMAGLSRAPPQGQLTTASSYGVDRTNLNAFNDAESILEEF